jgi:hypothetical protein
MTYTPDFRGVWAKIDRAREHTQTLNNEIGVGPDGVPTRFAAINRVSVRLEYEPDTGYHVFRTAGALPEDVLRRWGVIAGDVIHNLRSALDHVVWQLSLVGTGGAEPKNPDIVKFPIQDNPPRYYHGKNFQRTAALHEVPAKYRAIIYEHQPHGSAFNFGHGTVHPFSRLRDLSNLDNHQLIIKAPPLADNLMVDTEAIFGDAGAEIIEQHFVDGVVGEPLVRGAEMMRVKVRPASLQLNMEMAGYIAVEPSFKGVVPSGVTYVRSISLELLNMTMQTIELVREVEKAL